ncbi:MAG: tRNA-intron lyase [archaeon]
MARLYSNKVVVFEKKVKDVLIPKSFGEKKDLQLVLDLKESLYLLKREKLSIEDQDGKSVSFEDLLNFAQKREKNFYNKLVVYTDLRERGYVVKTGFKFGFDFRVYPRGKKPGEEHTQWVIHVASQDEQISIPNFSRMVRLSGNLKTELVIAIADSEDDVNYYSTKRITP